jgi:hypothetical protein
VPCRYRGLYSVCEQRLRGVSKAVRILIVLIRLEYYLLLLQLSLYLIVIIDDSEFINDNNNKNPIILLFNIGATSLNTIKQEDKGPIFSPILKKTKRGTRILFIK